ncbi:MAG: hypothetical protein IT320_18725 [Anaerolineae bacterium]|nr:hypothetical protein [Anaerolineae bacterium]
MAHYYIGIDGGGSNLRVAVVDENMHVVAQAMRGTANPSAIGREASAALIQEAIREAVAAAPPAQDGTGDEKLSIVGVGIGIAGASSAYAEAWLRDVIHEALPGVFVAPSMDNEIALVGAHGARRGVLVLAGTGSVAYAVNDAGETAQAGGWGYLLGDEGGGYWLTMEALRALIRWADGMQPEADALSRRVMRRLGFHSSLDLIPWLYRQPPPTREVAQHAGLVLDAADEGDLAALEIVGRGADALAALVAAVSGRLGMEQPAIGFAGGLLSSDNPLSRALCARLKLDAIPQALYSPVVGAALLARLSAEQQSSSGS